MSGAKTQTTEPKSSNTGTENGSDSNQDKSNLNISGQGVHSKHSSNNRTSGDHAEGISSMEHLRYLYDDKVEKLEKVEQKSQKYKEKLAIRKSEIKRLKEKDKKQQFDLTSAKDEQIEKDLTIKDCLRKIETLEAEKDGLAKKTDRKLTKLKEKLATKKKELKSLKEHNEKQQSDLLNIKEELVEKSHKIMELSDTIKSLDAEKNDLSQTVTKITNTMKAMELSSYETKKKLYKINADQNKKIENLENAMSQMTEAMEATKMENKPQTQTSNNQTIVPTAPKHRPQLKAPRPQLKAPRPVNASNRYLPGKQDKKAKRPLPPIAERK